MEDVSSRTSIVLESGYQGTNISTTGDVNEWYYKYGHPNAVEEAKLHESSNLPPYTIVPDGKWKACDVYSVICIALALPVALAVYVVNFLNGLFIWPVMRLYMGNSVEEEWDLSSCHWNLFCVYCFVIGLPMILVNMVYLLFIFIWVVLTGLPFTLLNSRARNAFCNNWKILRPFLGAPGTYITPSPTSRHDLVKSSGVGFNYFDVMLSMMAHINRRGVWKAIRAWPQNMALTPLFKYFCVCNPFIHKLQNIFINQWTEVINADWDEDIDENDLITIKEFLIKMTIDQQNPKGLAKLIGSWPFIGIYPRPPKNRKSRTVNGIQICSKEKAEAQKCGTMRNTLITTTFHSAFLEDNVTRSDVAKFGVVVVYLQLWNPYHFCVGEVEVNVRKDARAEHPMWLVTDPECFMGPYILDMVNKVFGNLVYLLGRMASNIKLEDRELLNQSKNSIIEVLAEEARDVPDDGAWERAKAAKEGKSINDADDKLFTTEQRRNQGDVKN